jgi:CubicO group peptidase (beta-lactamase class C family)
MGGGRIWKRVSGCMKVSNSLTWVFTWAVAFCFLIPSSLLFAQNQERSLTLNPRQLDSALKKKDRFPTNIEVSVSRDRPTFKLTYLQVETKIAWDIQHSLTNEQFEAANRDNASKKLKLVVHHEYTVKGDNLHVALWKFDKDFEQPKEEGVWGKTDKPKPKAMDIVWKVGDKVPASGKVVPAFAPLDKLLLDFTKANQVTGLSVAVFYKGKPVYARAFGHSNVQLKSKLNPDQPLRIFGLSRFITAIGIQQLIENGKIKRTDTVWDMLKLKEPKDANFKEITVGDLLQDAGGFSESISGDVFGIPRDIASDLKVKYPLTVDHVIEYMLKRPLDFKPGSKQAYSKFGFCLLGRVIEKASDMKYDEYCEKNIFKPLKIKSMKLGKSLKKERAQNESNYYVKSGAFTTQIASAENLYQWVQIPDGGIPMAIFDSWGGWIGTPTDVLTIVNAVRTDKKSPILSPAGIKQMFAPPVGISEIETGGKKLTKYTNFGWSQSLRGNDNAITFAYGSGWGSSSVLAYHTNDFSWVIISNCTFTKDKVNPSRKVGPMMYGVIEKIQKDQGL